MSERKEQYWKIREIFSQVPEVTLRESRNGHFHFPIYMTESLANTDIEALELGVRSYNCLKRAGIYTIGQLCERVHSSSDLKTIRNCGKTSVAEIMDHLFCYQYYFLKEKRREKYLKKVMEMNSVK